jgi:hypothetical protein
MATRQFVNIQTLNKFVKIIAGTFEVAASGGAATKVKGMGWEVAETATGEYTITLDDQYNGLLSCQLTIEAATPVDLVAQLDSHDVTVSPPVVVLNLLAGAIPTEPSAITRVHFMLMLSNTSLPEA